MKSKVFFLSTILLLLTVAAYPQIKIGVLGGVNFQNINGKDYQGDKLDHGLTLGFHAGANVNIPIAQDFYLQPGLLFTIKGSQNWGNGMTGTGDYTTKTKISYIELPINLLYRAQVGEGYILLGFGPYLAYGIGGNETTGDDKRPIKFKYQVRSLTELQDNAYYRAFDAGANIFFGYEIPAGIFLQLNTQLGLVEFQPTYDWMPDTEASYKNTGFGLSVGYRF
ncbi:MAG: PorT family protein [Bacteroidales bacterium]|nr:PorT family protein [Bacteroidales bacterium]